MTKQELKADIQAAYDQYLDGLDALAEEFTIVPGSPRQVQDDTRTQAQAAILWEQFERTEDKLNAEYFEPRETEEKKKYEQEKEAQFNVHRYEQAMQNLAWAEQNLENERSRVKAIRASGGTVTENEETVIIDKAQHQADYWQGEVDKYKNLLAQ